MEIYTRGGLLTLLWHGGRTAEHVALMGGGAMGGLLGPAQGLFHDLGSELAGRGMAAIRIGYRQPNDLDECVLDMIAAADLASRSGAARFVTIGHSFGGAVAVGAGTLLGDRLAGVVTLATQSAGCEMAEMLAGVPMLLFHGDRDPILPVMCSEVVAAMAGGADVIVLPGAGHVLDEAADELRTRLYEWVPAVLSAAPA